MNCVETLNQNGLQFPIFGVAQEAINYSKNDSVHQALDLGCAFGVVSLAFLKHTNVIAVDAHQDHLNALKEEYSNGQYSKDLTTIHSKFPDLDLPDNSLDVIYAGNIFCFLSGDDFKKGLKKIKGWLKSGGKLFASHISIFHKRAVPFYTEYNKRVDNNEPWPGYCEDVNKYLPKLNDKSAPLPSAYHLYDVDVFKREALDKGFNIESCEYYPAPEFLNHLTLDGRELIRLILSKN